MKPIIIFPLLLVLTACKHPQQQVAAPPSLPVMVLQAGAATTFQDYPAAIEGTDNVEIRPQVSGILQKIFVDEGAYVAAGQPLFQIETAPFTERLRNAQATLHAATGALANADLEIDKLTPLVANKVVADIQLRTAQSAREVALANMEQAKADIATAQINLGYTLVKAPVSGYIGRLWRKQGSLVGPADPQYLTDLSDVHTVHVYFALGEHDFIRFKAAYAGRTLTDKLKQLPPVTLILADDSAYALPGKIDMIDGQFDKTTGAITVRATFTNSDGLLRSGNTGKVRLGLQFSDQVILPQAATQEMQDKIFVFLVGDSNKISKQPIVIAGKTGSNYLVKEGLKPGDRVVLRGYDHLQEGDAIQPVTEKGPLANN